MNNLQTPQSTIPTQMNPGTNSVDHNPHKKNYLIPGGVITTLLIVILFLTFNFFPSNSTNESTTNTKGDETVNSTTQESSVSDIETSMSTTSLDTTSSSSESSNSQSSNTSNNSVDPTKDWNHYQSQNLNNLNLKYPQDMYVEEYTTPEGGRTIYIFDSNYEGYKYDYCIAIKWGGYPPVPNSEEYLGINTTLFGQNWPASSLTLNIETYNSAEWTIISGISNSTNEEFEYYITPLIESGGDHLITSIPLNIDLEELTRQIVKTIEIN